MHTKVLIITFCGAVLGAVLHADSFRPKPVIPGIEVLLTEQRERLRGKRIGLITNHTAVDRRQRHAADLLAALPETRLVALFSPEHGIRGTAPAGQEVSSGTDPTTGVPVYSLYGAVTEPTPEMLENVDVLVYDIQDAGARFYTYISTLGRCLRVAAARHIAFLVLDRPNPLNGTALEGPLLDPKFRSFVGEFPIPIRYGLTAGELALWIRAEESLDLDLHVVKMKNWRRKQWYDDTGLKWVPPSPNLPTVEAAVVYPGLCLIEGTNLSEGRGTAKPFEQIGAPWIDGPALAEALTARSLPGAEFRAVQFTPTSSKFAGQLCQGIQVQVADRSVFSPVMTALEILAEVRRRYPSQFVWNARHFDRLAGTDTVRSALDRGTSAAKLVDSWNGELNAFRKQIDRFLLYR
ncbi:MAG: DUF1343 domain-containing protein [Acidobacteriota bacterium]